MRNLSASSGQLQALAAFSLDDRAPLYVFNRVSTGPLAGVDVLEKHFFAPAFNRTTIPRSSVPSPSHYIYYANPTPFHTSQDTLLYKISPVI